MKKKLIISGTVVLLGLAALLSYLRFADPITLILENQSDLVSEVQWTCNSIPKGDVIPIAANSKAEQTVYASCEGAFGIVFINKNEKTSQELIGYIPTGKPERISVKLNNDNKISFKVED